MVIAPSPDPAGREIPVVRHCLNLTLLAAAGVTRGVEIALAAPFTLHQSGAGLGALLDQRGPVLAPRAVRDPRLGIGFARRYPRLLTRPGLSIRLDVSLPLGDERELAGDRSAVLAPQVAADLSLGRLHLGGTLGARLREPNEIANTRMGSQLWIALGASLELMERGLLSIAVESWMLPSLAQEPLALADEPGQEQRHMPAEWMASLSLAPRLSDALVFQLGAGTGLPLSSSPRPDGGTEPASSMTTPDVRLVAVGRLRYRGL
ncbi:hypothetical protein ACFL5O_02355 [Myxococcota bacterium]